MSHKYERQAISKFGTEFKMYKENDNNLNLFIFDGCNELVELYEMGQPITASEMIEMLLIFLTDD